MNQKILLVLSSCEELLLVNITHAEYVELVVGICHIADISVYAI